MDFSSSWVSFGIVGLVSVYIIWRLSMFSSLEPSQKRRLYVMLFILAVYLGAKAWEWFQ